MPWPIPAADEALLASRYAHTAVEPSISTIRRKSIDPA
jgi:hypothetical protein